MAFTQLSPEEQRLADEIEDTHFRAYQGMLTLELMRMRFLAMHCDECGEAEAVQHKAEIDQHQLALNELLGERAAMTVATVSYFSKAAGPQLVSLGDVEDDGIAGISAHDVAYKLFEIVRSHGPAINALRHLPKTSEFTVMSYRSLLTLLEKEVCEVRNELDYVCVDSGSELASSLLQPQTPTKLTRVVSKAIAAKYHAGQRVSNPTKYFNGLISAKLITPPVGRGKNWRFVLSEFPESTHEKLR